MLVSRIAIKRLTNSDLGFFEPMYRKTRTSNQKAINLNADVFVETFYPGLTSTGARADQEIPVSLIVVGPDGAEPERIARTITRSANSKNWRLNGEFVHDPDDQTGRFNNLAVNDLAILDFRGDPDPDRVRLLLVSATAAKDAGLHGALMQLFADTSRTMIAVEPSQLSLLAGPAPQDHPIWQFAEDESTSAALQDAAVGGVEGTTTLTRRGVVVSTEALARARRKQEETGRIGEALAWTRIEEGHSSGSYSVIEWSSSANAVSRYDFRVTETSSGEDVRIDAKSTSRNWDEPVHMSIAEINEAASQGRYDLWRLYEVALGRGRLKISEDIGAFAQRIRDSLNLPEGVTVDNVSIDPMQFDWQDQPDIVVDDSDETT